MPRDTSTRDGSTDDVAAVLAAAAGPDANARKHVRRLGAIVTFALGPVLAAFASFGLGMGPLETGAILILVSVWLGPKLMGVTSL